MGSIPAGRMAALAIVMALSGSAIAQSAADKSVDSFPSRPVTFIVPLAPGGPNDIEARLYTVRLATLMGQPFLVDYKPGASGTIGAGYVARSAPDGYTLLLTGGSFTALRSLFKDLPFDTIRDFAPVSQMSTKHFVLAVSASHPARTFADYLAYARANPGKINFATTGAGGSVHLGGAWLHNLTDTKVTFVHYKGTAPLSLDLVSGAVDVGALGVQPALPLLKAGKIRALAMMGDARSNLVPGAPRIMDSVPGYRFESWIGLTAPGATPAGIVNKLNQAFVKVVRMPEVVSALEAQASVPVGSTPAQFRELLATEIERWRKVVQDNGIKLEE